MFGHFLARGSALVVDAKHSPCDASGSDAGLSKYIEVFPMCKYSSAISLHAPHEFNVRAQSIYFLVALPEDVDLASDFGGRCSAGRYTCLVIDLCESATGRRGAPYESANSKRQIVNNMMHVQSRFQRRTCTCVSGSPWRCSWVGVER